MSSAVDSTGTGSKGRGKPLVFISYSHKDEVWKDRLRPHLSLLERDGRIVIWDDRQIEPTAEWYDEIRDVMTRASIAVCLISADYLASEFCTKEEIPYLLRRRNEEGMHLFLVLLRPCAWQAVSWLKAVQMLPRDGRTIASDFRDDWDTPFADLAGHIFGKLSGTAPGESWSDDSVLSSVRRPPRVTIGDDSEPRRLFRPALTGERIAIDRLPATGAELFGRQAELKLLDEAWASDNTHVVSLVAWGGVGKSTLVNKWLEGLKADNWRGATRVYGWSFYSQGTGERVTSADEFIADALRFFGDPDPTQGSPWSKGERLAELVRNDKSLLVLDGLEPLQSGHDFEKGQIKDPGLARLVEELAHENQGLCLITTRERVAELEENDWRAFVAQIDLEQISPEAGRALLRVKGVRGSDAELEQASRDFGNHALAISLLASLLRAIPRHPIAAARDVPDLDISLDSGRHPRRVMAAFAARFGNGPEVEVLRMLGLFDRPATANAIHALRKPPPLPGLTDHVCGLEEAEWLILLDKLRDVGLIAPKSHRMPHEIDAHPLVRQHFGEDLKDRHLGAWRAGHGRLYKHFSTTAKLLPDTLEEMAPLYQAMLHGCQAGHHQHALLQYFVRALRGPDTFSTTKLGAIGPDLAALAAFLEEPSNEPFGGIRSEADRAFVLTAYGFCLRSLGRLREAAFAIEKGQQINVIAKDWVNAAIQAVNLSNLHLILGDIERAFVLAEKSVTYADDSSDDFWRSCSRVALAAALHNRGKYERALTLFEEAEALQERREPKYPLLYSKQGLEYCDFLLDSGKFREVRERSRYIFNWAKRNGAGILTLALSQLALAEADLLSRSISRFNASVSVKRLNTSLDDLRRAGQIDELPRGLLARAALYRVIKDDTRARRDLDEAMRIANRCGMRLFECDAHREYARLELSVGNRDKARGHAAIAKGMVDEMDYHRRDREVAELEASVGPL